MKWLLFIFILTILLSGCDPYTEQYTIQGRWYKDLDNTTIRELLDFGDDWLLIGIDHGIWIEETSRHSITYWNGMVYFDFTYYEYKIYGKYLQIWDDEYIREIDS
ncbi:MULTISPECIES: hypothetical protein [unclassified Oceanispirochaeta]|uniref:hypothetical protein n=1 Tax=unclassified Oceanispirochaeta TaxID=2635722 RepID=UPI000E09539F|nr:MULTISPECIES: hypothetical protein [unclassified Oceanispirochaeta]MBF9018894.1 hypothetical protein [Oceanispirochaeta sp. M2]NPD75393.1 hypothetical protein [Oceanispirochaeta sp. M1]RDG28756.1 hypothetical protein DV872_25190 [Oceanispirochaeta sp. M1]